MVLLLPPTLTKDHPGCTVLDLFQFFHITILVNIPNRWVIIKNWQNESLVKFKQNIWVFDTRNNSDKTKMFIALFCNVIGIHTPPVIHVSYIFHRGCVEFRWNYPMYSNEKVTERYSLLKSLNWSKKINQILWWLNLLTEIHDFLF